MKITWMLASVVSAGLLSAADWNSAVYTGSFTNPASWVGGVVPVNGGVANFPLNGNLYTVLFPAGGVTNGGVFRSSGIGAVSAVELALDLRGSFWTGYGTGDRVCFQSAGSGGSQLLNVEGGTNNAAVPAMQISNAVFRTKAVPAVVTNIFESGSFNFYDPLGYTNNSVYFLVGNAVRATTLIFSEGSSVRAGRLWVRGRDPLGTKVLFNGGSHFFNNGLEVNDTGGIYPVEITAGSGSDVFFNGGLSIGSWGLGRGELAVRTGGVVRFKGPVTVGSGGTGTLTVDGGIFTNLSTSASDDFYVGHNNSVNSTGILNLVSGMLVSKDSVLAQGNGASFINLLGGSMRVLTTRLGNTSANVTNHMLVAGGTHYLANGFDFVVGNISSAVYDQTGGSVLLQADLRIGQANRSSLPSSPSLVRMTGGTLRIDALCVAYIGYGTLNWGRMELLGGALEVPVVKGGSGFSELYASGGTIRLSRNVGQDIVKSIQSAIIGPGGLTIDTTAEDITVNQAFSGSGDLFKTGSGTLTFYGTSSHRSTVVAQGTLKLAAGAAPGGGITVTNNAIFSLAGAVATFTIGDLTLGDNTTSGNLVYDTDDRIVVTGALTIVNGRITIPDVLTQRTVPLFTVSGNHSASVLSGLEIVGMDSSRSYDYTAVYNDQTDTTDLSLVISTRVWSTAEWTGLLSGEWTTVGNWSPEAAPTRDTVLTFPGTASQKNITVSTPASAGGLVVRGSYAINGEQIDLGGDISVEAGNSVIGSALSLLFTGFQTVSVATGQTIEVQGNISGRGGIRKTGTGAATLRGANTFSGGLDSGGGLLTVASAGAFGTATTAGNGVIFSGGTLRYTGGETQVNGFTINSGAGKAAVIDAQTDLAFSGTFGNTSGALIKRGTGTVALTVPASSSMTLTTGNGTEAANNSGSALTFPADGIAPLSGFAGFTIAEGQVRIKGPSSATVNLPNSVYIGANCLTGTGTAALEVDGVKMTAGGGGKLVFVGPGTPSGSTMTNSLLRIVNGAVVTSDTIWMLRNAQKSVAELTVNGSTLNTTYEFGVQESAGSLAKITLTNAAALNVTGNGGAWIKSPFDCVLSGGSVLNQSRTAGIRFQASAAGSMRVIGGSKVIGSWMTTYNNVGRIVTVDWDNGSFEPVGMIYTSRVNQVALQGMNVLNGGWTVTVGSGAAHTLALPIRGTGDLIKTGTGDLTFLPLQEATSDTAYNQLSGPSLQTTGRVRVNGGRAVFAQGSVSNTVTILAAAGATANLNGGTISPRAVGGAGTISSGTLGGSYLCTVSGVLASEKTTFADVSTVAGFAVDFGRTEDNPLPLKQKIAIANYTGTAPVVSQWKTVNAGRDIRAVFTAEAGVIYAECAFIGGTRIILR